MSVKYFIAVVSREHVMIGVKGGFAQAGHGKSAPLKRMKKGDWLIYYSPVKKFKTKDSDDTPEKDNKCQCFTAIGVVKDERIYQVEMSKDFVPNRRDVDYKKCKETSIIPLIDKLSFIKDKKHWGYQFRFGIVEIPEPDFKIISKLMLKN
jgi:predicted RNA-binding protein